MREPCPPRFATPGTPGRKSLGHEVAAIAAQLGTPLLPWQRQVADVATEIDPATGLPAYREIDVLVSRQSGKTSLMLAILIHRCLRWPGGPQRVIYSAQTGSDSRRKMLDDWVPALKTSPAWAAVSKVVRAGGREAIEWRTGSRIDVLSSSEGAGHGRVVDLAVLDEAFDDADDRREAAVAPAQATRPSAQLWVISTAGSDQSVYLRRKVDAGRAAVADGVTEGICYFEWSAPDEADIDDPETWWSCMPALGYTIDEATIRHARRTMSENEFRRAFLNQTTIAEERVIPAAWWAAVCSEDVVADRSSGFVLALDVDLEQSAASIVGCDVHGNIEVVEYRDTGSVGWVPDRLAELAKTCRSPSIVIDSRGPAANLFADLERAHVRRIIAYQTNDMTAASASFLAAVADKQIRVQSHPAIDAAVSAARRRAVGDLWLWARRDTGRDVSPLVAATMAHHRATNPPPRPRFINLSGPRDPSAIPPPGRGTFWP